MNKKVDNEILATYYVFLGQNEKALTSLEEAYNQREFSWLKFLNVWPTWDPLRKEPRFHALLVRMGFK
jgi:hypothetical protein